MSTAARWTISNVLNIGNFGDCKRIHYQRNNGHPVQPGHLEHPYYNWHIHHSFRRCEWGTPCRSSLTRRNAGVESGTGNFSVSTYHSAADNTPYPSGPSRNVNRAGFLITGANVADRFWIIVPAGYSTVSRCDGHIQRYRSRSRRHHQQHFAGATLADRNFGLASRPSPDKPTLLLPPRRRFAIPGASIASIWAPFPENNLPLPIQLISFTAESERRCRVDFLEDRPGNSK